MCYVIHAVDQNGKHIVHVSLTVCTVNPVLSDVIIDVAPSSMLHLHWDRIRACSQPSDNGDHFPQILDTFQHAKIGFLVAVYGKPQFLKIAMIDEVTLWSKLESTTRFLLILSHRRTIFKMLTLEQLAEKWSFSAGLGRSSNRSDPPPWLRACNWHLITKCCFM